MKTLGEINNFDELFFDIPLYQSISIETHDIAVENESVDDYIRNNKFMEGSDAYNVRLKTDDICRFYCPSQLMSLIKLLLCPPNISGYCPCCKTNRVFSISKTEYNDSSRVKLFRNVLFEWTEDDEDSDNAEVYELNSRIQIILENAHYRHINKELKCLLCNSEYHFSFRLELGRERLERGLLTLSITKIGQYPAPIEFSRLSLNNNHKLLKKMNALEDYKAAHSMSATGSCLASFLFFRRVFEKLLIWKFNKLPTPLQAMTIDQFKGLAADKKIDCIKIDSTEFFAQNRTLIYDILSKSIHELDEQFCEDHYKILKSAIEIILSEEETMRLETEAKKDIAHKLNETHKGISRQKK